MKPGIIRAVTVAGALTAAGLAAPTGATAAGSAIQFGKIYYDSPGSDTGGSTSLNAEWVRITNHASSSRGLGGWKLKDAQNHVFTFPAGFRLAAGATVKVHSGKGSNSGTNRYWGQSWYVWNNSGDKATLKNASGTVVDTCAWTRIGVGYKTC
jgi:hypothetical protein